MKYEHKATIVCQKIPTKKWQTQTNECNKCEST